MEKIKSCLFYLNIVNIKHNVLFFESGNRIFITHRCVALFNALLMIEL